MNYLPAISRGGIFRSAERFPGVTKTELRTVTSYELELFSEDGGISYLNGEAYPIRRGNLLFARPGDRRQSLLPFRCLFLHFTDPFEESEALLAEIPSLRSLPDPNGYAAAMREIIASSYDQSREAKLRTAGQLFLLLSRLLSDSAVAAENERHSTVVSDAERFMAEFFAQRLTLADIAEHCHLSPVYFHSLYTRITGRTPREYLAECRLNAARGMLRTTALSISEVAAGCGFASQAYFSNCFRVAFGQTPGDFRRAVLYPG